MGRFTKTAADEVILKYGSVPMGYREIPGYEGHYAINRAGVVRSIDSPLTVYHERRRRKPRKGKELSQKKHRTGHTVKLSVGGEAHEFYVARLLYMTWEHGALLPENSRIRHINGDVYDDSLDNLRLDVKEKAPN